MKGLIIKPVWAELILDGSKNLEIRGSNAKHRGITGIIESKSQMVFGTAELVETIKLTKDIFENTKKRHLLNISWEELLTIYPTPWAWSFINSNKYKLPIKYDHKQGCVIWVNII